MRTMILITIAATCLVTSVPAQDKVAVTVDNFVRAETDMYFGEFARRGALGKFFHRRELPLENTGVRPNRDTLYSEAVFDLDAGPVTITLPDSGKRYMALMTIDEDHYVVDVAYGKSARTYDKDKVGTRYLFAAVRVLVDPANPEDLKQVHALQDGIEVRQKSAWKFEVPNWDANNQKQIRDALLALNDRLPDLRNAFGARGANLDPVRRLIGAASAWGANPDKDAIYIGTTPAKNDGKTVYRLDVPAKVPVDAFWSVIVYDATGHLQKNAYEAYSLNSITAKRNADGSVHIQFGGCDGKIANCLPTMPGWNYMVRLYRPHPEVLNGAWKFPESNPAS